MCQRNCSQVTNSYQRPFNMIISCRLLRAIPYSTHNIHVFLGIFHINLCKRLHSSNHFQIIAIKFHFDWIIKAKCNAMRCKDAIRCIAIELFTVVNGQQIVLLISESNAIETMTLLTQYDNPIR